MNRLLHHTILMAQQGRVGELGRGIRARRAQFETQDLITIGLILGGIALAVGTLSYLLRLHQRRRGRARPLRLFLSLCKAHRLRWSERWLLWRLARAHRLTDPARLFIEPPLLRAPSKSPSLQSRRAQLRQLRLHLFGQLPQPPPQNASEQPETGRPPAADTSSTGSEITSGPVVGQPTEGKSGAISDSSALVAPGAGELPLSRTP
jgi:hypothetical protein